jgi:O-antigen/teichoic acid export membrane protein
LAVEGFKTKLLSALGWSAALKVGFQALSWVMTLAVIRVLSPNDYGLMAISQAFMTFMLGFANLGLGDALMQRKDTPPLLVSYAFGLLLLVSVSLCAGLAIAAYPIAGWYGDPRLVPLLQLSSLGFVFNALTMLPRTMLAKEMQMRPIFAADLSSGLLGAVVTTILAFTGHGVWSLILGWVASNAVKQVAFLFVGRQFYVWPRLNIRAVRGLLGFGAFTTLEYTAFMITTTADVLIVSRLLGPAEVGIYTVVLNFAALPLSKVAPIVNSIAFPAFAMVQTDRKEASYYVLKGIRMMAVLVVPVFFGIASVAPEVVDIVFGPTWAAARPLLPILSIALTFRAMLILLPNYLMGIGDAIGSFWCTGTGTVIFPLAVFTGCNWGLEGACWAWLVCYPAVFAIEALIASRRGGFPYRAIVVAPLPPMVAGAVMAAVVTTVRILLPLTLSEIGRTAMLIAIGASVYPATLFIVFRPLAIELCGVFKSRRQAA